MSLFVPLLLSFAAQTPRVSGPATFETFRGTLTGQVRVGLVRDSSRIDLEILERVVAKVNEAMDVDLVLVDGWNEDGRGRAKDLGIDAAAVIRRAKVVEGRPQTIAYGPIGSTSGESVRYVGVAVNDPEIIYLGCDYTYPVAMAHADDDPLAYFFDRDTGKVGAVNLVAKTVILMATSDDHPEMRDTLFLSVARHTDPSIPMVLGTRLMAAPRPFDRGLAFFNGEPGLDLVFNLVDTDRNFRFDRFWPKDN